MNEPIDVKYRAANTGDMPFLYATWLKSQRRQGDNTLLTNNIYFRNMSKQIADIFHRSVLVIICNVEDANQIFGWTCFETMGELFIIHFAYVKKPYRQLGLMKTLLKKVYPKIGSDWVAITSICQWIAEKRKVFMFTFDPYLKGAHK